MVIKELFCLISNNIDIINGFLQLFAYVFPILIIFIKCIYSIRAKELLGLNLSKEDFKNLKFYISTYGQNSSPVDEKYLNDHNTHYNLIKFFIHDVFRKDKYGRYFIILADSGMGKSTLLQMIFLKYKRKIFKNKQIYFYPLSNKRNLNDIKEIENKYKSIILLDAFAKFGRTDRPARTS